MNSSKMNSAKFARVWGETERKIYMVYVLLANGFEEVEAIEPIDILRRCGAEVKTASVMKTKEVCGAHGITVTADIMISELDPENMEMVMLPGGGMGHELLDASNDVHGVINYAVSHGRYVAAICAAPSILGKKHLLNGKKPPVSPALKNISTAQRFLPKKLLRTANSSPPKAPVQPPTLALSLRKFSAVRKRQRKSAPKCNTDAPNKRRISTIQISGSLRRTLLHILILNKVFL